MDDTSLIACYTNLLTHANMSWTETSAGHFERPFDSLERFYRAISASGAAFNREHFVVNAVLRLRLNPSIGDIEQALRHAWMTLRHDYPQIAAYGRGSTYIYEVPSTSSINSWLSETFITQQTTASPSSVCEDSAPSELAKMHYFPHTLEILFRSSHWRIDGIGSLHLLNHFLKILARPRSVTFGDEPKNLSIGLDEAANTPSQVTSEMEQSASDLLMHFVNNLPSIGLPTSKSQNPGGSARCKVTFTLPLTTSIIARCKASGFSVTAATHAAVVGATLQHADPEKPADKYTSFSNFDLRKYCPPPYSGATKAVSIFHTGIPVVVKLSGFQKDAVQFQKLYSQRLNAPGQHNMFSFLACYVDKVNTLFMQPPPPGSLPPTEPSLSSLGIIHNFIANKHGNVVEVTDFWLGVDMLSRQLMVYIWTHQGKLQLSACYNKEFYAREFVENFLSDVKDVLVDGLEI